MNYRSLKEIYADRTIRRRDTVYSLINTRRVQQAVKNRKQKIGTNYGFSPDTSSHVGDKQQAIAGKCGTATSGDFGTAIAGRCGTATSGYRGTAIAGDFGTAIAGRCGTATSGYRGTAISGYNGTAIAGRRGTAIAGDFGTAIAGDFGEIHIQYWDGSRYRTVIGYVGEDGIKPNTAYRLNNKRQLEEVIRNI